MNARNNNKSKLCKYLGTLALVFAPAMMMAAQKQTPLFMYGFAASFNDSTVYFTDVQQVEKAWTDSKTGFLYSRDNYSYQLRENLQARGLQHPTCVTVYGKTRKEVEKKYVNMKKRYATNGHYDVKYIPSNEFKFEPIEPDDSEKASANTKKKEKKK